MFHFIHITRNKVYKAHSGLILEFKGSVRYVQKWHPTFITQVDLIPLNL